MKFISLNIFLFYFHLMGLTERVSYLEFYVFSLVICKFRL